MTEEHSEKEKHEHNHAEHHEHAEHKEHAEHEEHKHMYMEHHQHQKNKGYMIATWILAGVCVLLLIGLIVSLAVGGKSNGANGGATVSADKVKATTETYLKSIANGNASVDNITDVGGYYYLRLTVAGKQYESYVSKDGKLLFPQGIYLSTPVQATQQQPATPTVVPKTDKPTVELFVMAYCPYGTEAEKGILPAVRALGDKIDFKVRFVYYAMHGLKEVKEDLNQYCIETEQPDKYLKYLACFLNDSAGQGSDSAIAACIASTGVDTTKLEACKTATDTKFNVMSNYNNQSSWLNGQFPKIDLNADLNTKYNIGGSPTLIINGVEYNDNGQRSPANFLSYICAAFNNAPAECQTQLDTANPSTGFGYGTAAAATAAGCGA